MTTVEMTAPERSVEQRMRSLAEANRVRVLRAGVKRDVREGRLKAADLVLDLPPDLRTMKVRDLLLAMRQYGPSRADRLLRSAGIAPAKTLGGLSPRQRSALVEGLS